MPKGGSSERVRTTRVFLSYAQRERELAAAVGAELQSRGIDAWDEARGITPGSVWSDTFSSALEESDSMIALLSARSFSSEYVRKQLDFALFDERYKNRLLPVLVGDSTIADFVQLPWILTKLEYLKLREAVPMRSAARTVVDAFVKLLAGAGGRT